MTLLKDRILKAFGAFDPKEVGIHALPTESRDSLRQLLEALKRYGVFVVPVGKLEAWLPEYGISGKGPSWLENILAALDSDRIVPAPSVDNDDVWRFMTEVAAWLRDPDRRGIPAESE